MGATQTSTVTGTQPTQTFTSVFSQFNYAYNANTLGAEAPEVGSKSLFNEYCIFVLNSTQGDYTKLYNRISQPSITPNAANQDPAVSPSVGTIVNWANGDIQGGYGSTGAAPYSYADFLYCKYHGKIPNNYLVTLRRYPFPMYDNLQTPSKTVVPPVAQAVTWFGEETGNSLKDFLKFSFGQNWKDLNADVQEVQGNEVGSDHNPIGSDNGAVQGALGIIAGLSNPNQYSGLSRAQTEWSEKQYGSEGAYANKVYGPVNAITQTKARDRGMHWAHDITLNFHYSLRSIGDINPKAAMLDILANMLTLTYNNAKFWGGAIRYFPQYPNTPFFGDQNKYYNGDVGGYIDSVGAQFSKVADKFTSALQSMMSGSFSDIISKIGGAGLQTFFGSKAAKNRPQILSFRSLLTGAPVGEWHLVVGNPLNPIAMIGNLVCENIEIEFNDELGPDDFPTEMKVTVKLEHGRPRDKGDIESMFNMGNGRLYMGINDDLTFSSTSNSVVDTSGTKGNQNNVGKSSGEINTPQSQQQIQANNQAATQTTPATSMWGGRFANSPSEILNLLKRN